MNKLSDNEKQKVAQKSIESILQVSKLHAIDFINYPKGTRNYIIAIYTAGMGDAIKALKKNEKD